MNIGNRLKDTRVDHDHEQKDTAEVLQISEKQVIRYEKDRQEMGIRNLNPNTYLY